MTHVHSDPERVHAVADALNAISRDLYAGMEALERQALSVMTSDWTGDAAASHHALWTEWVQSAKAIITSLAVDAELVHQVAASYAETDKSSAERTIRTLSLGTTW